MGKRGADEKMGYRWERVHMGMRSTDEKVECRWESGDTDELKEKSQ